MSTSYPNSGSSGNNDANRQLSDNHSDHDENDSSSDRKDTSDDDSHKNEEIKSQSKSDEAEWRNKMSGVLFGSSIAKNRHGRDGKGEGGSESGNAGVDA